MTTDIVIRYAEDINEENEITKFNLHSISGKDISAVSWELPGAPRKNSGEILLKKMLESHCSAFRNEDIYTFVILSPEQPDSAIVNHRKAWGILKFSGVKVDEVEGKKDFIVKGNDGLILSGMGIIKSNSIGVIESLINCGEQVFFSTIPSNEINMTASIPKQITEWMSSIWVNNGVVFFALGRYDEPDSEIVALSQRRNLKNLIFPNDNVKGNTKPHG